MRSSGIFDWHYLDGEAHDVDRGEGEISASHRCLFAESVLEDASAASHRSHFVHVSPGVVGTPFGALIESRVEIEKVREESACRDLAGEPVQVVVAVFRQIAYAAFLFPYLDGEDGGCAVAHAFVGGVGATRGSRIGLQLRYRCRN